MVLHLGCRKNLLEGFEKPDTQVGAMKSEPLQIRPRHQEFFNKIARRCQCAVMVEIHYWKPRSLVNIQNQLSK